MSSVTSFNVEDNVWTPQPVKGSCQALSPAPHQ
jgi:hypothetical protein